MARCSIPVDLFNPGQVFACLGILEAADVLLGAARASFDWGGAGPARFVVEANGDRHPIEAVLGFLREAEVRAVTPFGWPLATDKLPVPVEPAPDEVYPFPAPVSPATLVCRLSNATGAALEIGYWGAGTSVDNTKFWAGAGGYPGSALVRDAIALLPEDVTAIVDDPFDFAAEQSSSFRFDWRRDYVPLDLGFSPNAHGNAVMVGYPVVELCAAIGLSHARPVRLDKLDYRYRVIAAPPGAPLLVPLFHRAALGGATLPFACRKFRMQLDWPGQENQARCITDVHEETPA